MQIIDCHPPPADIHAEVIQGLNQQPKHLPCKYFYDARGAGLFEAICDLPEYYPTRTEIGILRQHLPEIARDLGPERWVIEPGSGSGIKTKLLLSALTRPGAYLPIDISRKQLIRYASHLSQDFPDLPLHGICADFTQAFDLPPIANPVIWFPGSTIGNFSPEQARQFLQQMANWGRAEQADLLIGVDLEKPVEILEAAYNDAQGLTASFNLNLLRHIGGLLDTNLNEEQFEHRAIWNAELGAIQMFLLSRQPQQIHVGAERFSLSKGESICTEYSYKYAADDFTALAAEAGWSAHRCYTDPASWFAVFHLRRGDR